MKGWKQNFQANGQGKKAGVAILISDKIDFKKKATKRDTEGHFKYFRKESVRKTYSLQTYTHTTQEQPNI